MGHYNYILSGLGKLEGVTYANTEKLLNILDRNDVIDKLMKIPQLGAIMYSMPGAKHTRYEYVILQFDLINKLQPYKGNEYNGMGNKKYKLINQNAPFEVSEDINLTLGDMLQMLALISNIGYTKNTFLDSRVMLKFLKGNKKFKQKYKYAVGNEFSEYLIEYIEKNNYWSLHYLNSVIILKSIINDSNKNIIYLALNILEKYLNNSRDNPIKEYIQIFKNIRSLAYVIIDLNFSPLPLNFNFNNIPALLEKIVSKHSDTFNTNHFINDISALLEKNIYLEPNNLLCMSCLEKYLYKDLEAIDLNKRNVIKSILGQDSIFFKDFKIEEKWDKNILKIDIPYKKIYSDIRIIIDKLTEINGIVVYSSEHRNTELIRLCLSLKKNHTGNKSSILKKIFCYINELIGLLERIGENTNEFKILMTKFYLKNMFPQNNIYLESKISPYDYNFISVSNGVLNTTKYVDNYLKQNVEINKDQKYEIVCTKDILEKIKFTGLSVFLMCSIKIKNKEYKDLAEIDGIIIYPNQCKVVLVEAKNKKASEHEAKDALQEKINKLNLNSIGVLSELKANRYVRGYYSYIILQI